MDVQTRAASAGTFLPFAAETVGAFPGQTPSSFANLRIDAIHVVPSVLAVLRKEQVTNLYELSELPVTRLVRAPGVSLRKVETIRRQLRELAVRQNQFEKALPRVDSGASLKERLLRVAAVMPERDRLLLLDRCRLRELVGPSRATDVDGISRERIRQIVNRGLSFVENTDALRVTMRAELEAAWVDRNSPLGLSDVSALSPLWQGIETPREFAVWCIEEYLGAGWHLLSEPKDIVARMSQRELLTAVGKARGLVRERAPALIAWTETRSLVDGTLPEYASELRAWLWAQVEPEIHTINDARRGPLVVAFGTDAAAWIVSVLRKAGHPLTGDEIVDRCRSAGADVELSTIQRGIGVACLATGDGSYILRADATCLARRLEPLGAVLSSWLAARNGSFHCNNIAEAHPSIGPCAPFASAAYLCNAALALYGRSVRGNGHMSWSAF